MNNRFIPVNTPLLSGNEKKYINECIDTGWISSEGPFVERFEADLSRIVNRKYGVAVSSGTAALDIAVEALGIGKGDEVILPTFTIISCIHQIIRSGATPVFVDSEPITWNMDISQIEDKITKRTKAIMVVHIYGLPVDIDPVLKLARKYKLKIIEDAAEMIGQTYKGKPCGSYGDVSIFSFYPNKHITTGEGGMVVTNNNELAKKCQSLRNLCFQKKQRFVHKELGWNYRMTNLQAALGLAQLEQLDKFVEKKRKMGKFYTDSLKEMKQIQVPLEETSYAKNIYWVFGIVLKNNAKNNAKKIMGQLQELGIGTRPFFYPLHLQPYFKNKFAFYRDSYPVSENMSQMGFYLPSGLNLSSLQIENICNHLKSIFI
ncbi:aminotransferase DegT [archaeon]|nr:aminotransferase DegT [archaeon]|tara:strand:+ start:3903 stop:5024 length:1122 start_codon:yes stop_codon:yes gene_type:complete